jgi:hypothetical protein
MVMTATSTYVIADDLGSMIMMMNLIMMMIIMVVMMMIVMIWRRVMMMMMMMMILIKMVMIMSCGVPVAGTKAIKTFMLQKLGGWYISNHGADLSAKVG